MRKVLLTGPTGFIGRNSIDILLSRGFEVHAISREVPNKQQEGLFWYQADLLDIGTVSKLVSEIQPTHMLHFAWYAVPKEYWTSPENIRWVQASLELIHSFIQYGGKRIVMAGSCAEYDWNYGYCSEEFTPLKPSTLYGTCKHSLQEMLKMYTDQLHISSAWGRIFFLYGPYEHPSRLVSHVISSLLKNKQAVCSAGTQIRDFMYVEDVASSFVSLLDSTVEGPVNICSGQPTSIKEVVTQIGNKIGRGELIKFGTELIITEPPLLIGDNRRLMNEVKWTQQTDLSKGIDMSIDWWEKQFV
ncbi:MAG: NAD(P)-dependent oxidoreductase [Sediminibacterium sp.]|nr:NAD(P)-dependent oxidoreductase [Sediminibacterium sp.]